MSWLILVTLAAQAATPSSIGCDPAQARACTQSIYFDSGEATKVRPEWTGVIDAVAASARSGGQIRLDGFSDRSGPVAANRHVSKLRAEAIRALLLQRGVPAAAITLAAHGESDLRVPTEDGVREPQNRRVDLTLSR